MNLWRFVSSDPQRRGTVEIRTNWYERVEMAAILTGDQAIIMPAAVVLISRVRRRLFTIFVIYKQAEKKIRNSERPQHKSMDKNSFVTYGYTAWG